MLFKTAILERIKAGEVTLAFRSWKRPSVKAGGRLRTAVGVLAIEEVNEVRRDEITERDAQQAGFDDREALLKALLNGNRHGSDRKLYRIAFHHSGEDPRVSLRASAMLEAGDVRRIAEVLNDIDRRSRSGPWTAQILEIIATHEGHPAGESATALRLDKTVFKQRVRRFKELGLTESLQVGYRLSPRGRAYLNARK